jgi:hypothetical protein
MVLRNLPPVEPFVVRWQLIAAFDLTAWRQSAINGFTRRNTRPSTFIAA